MKSVNEIVQNQRDFFYSDASKSVNFRINSLKKLYDVIFQRQDEIEEALQADLNKSGFEAYVSEVGMILDELRYTIKHLKKWTKIKSVGTPLLHFLSRSFIISEPFGVVLIMSPWNYPFLLTLSPLIGALAAGNCCVVKPSQYSKVTSAIIGEILAQAFPQEYVAVVQGGREANSELLGIRFDYIFFTGSPAVGHIVMESAAKFLTPVTLELGGKSPCIVDGTSDIELAAKRIVWGKFLNAGQTCVAPDFIIVQEELKESLEKMLLFYITKFYGEKPLENPELPKIINGKHFQRLVSLIEGTKSSSTEKIITGGIYDPVSEKVAPTLIENVLWDSPLMKEEIFGPLLPILTFKSYDNLIQTLKSREKPLALYIFSKDKKMQNRLLQSLSFGGGCINDTIIHLANPKLPFGGIGNSGMGQYHGKYSFETFSHKKSIIKKSNMLDVNLRYPPFKDHLNIIRKILK